MEAEAGRPLEVRAWEKDLADIEAQGRELKELEEQLADRRRVLRLKREFTVDQLRVAWQRVRARTTMSAATAPLTQPSARSTQDFLPPEVPPQRVPASTAAHTTAKAPAAGAGAPRASEPGARLPADAEHSNRSRHTEPAGTAAAASRDAPKRTANAEAHADAPARKRPAADKASFTAVARRIKEQLAGVPELELPVTLNPAAAALEHEPFEGLTVRFKKMAGPPAYLGFDLGLTREGIGKVHMTARAAEKELGFISNLNEKAAVDHVFFVSGVPLKPVVKMSELDAKRMPKEAYIEDE
jgi:hypothetical protein